jgi:hypothetical protein
MSNIRAIDIIVIDDVFEMNGGYAPFPVSQAELGGSAQEFDPFPAKR